MSRISVQHLPLQPTIQTQKKSIAQTIEKQSFTNHLKEVSQNRKLKISKHANERIIERNIS
ncbi:MAG TPA: flagellar protein, partial [Ureibacillus sp.]|nr:flagellar protein [Ureibacillus sp.]